MPALKITADDCRTCGACCVSGGYSTDALDYGYADMSPTDVARLSPHVRRQLHERFVGGETYHATAAKQLPSGKYACRYLRGTPGGQCSCSIYDTRPDVCRKFRVGGAMCKLARLAADVGQPAS